MQVITGVPARSGSGLEEVYSTISKSSSGTLDALTNALKVVGVAQLSSISNVAGNIVTILDIIKAGIDGASATETVTGFKCQYTTDVVVNIKYAFVKKMGQADSTQVLGYRGNYVDYTVNMTVPGSITVDGVVYSNIDNYKSNGVVKSAHYSNVVNKVADWAATSEANGTAIVNLYLLSKLKLSFFNGTSISLDLPNVLPPL